MSVQVPHGLDRAPLDQYNQSKDVEVTTEARSNSNSDRNTTQDDGEHDVDDTNHHASTKTKLKATAKRLFPLGKSSHNEETTQNAPTLATVPDGAQEDDRLIEDARQSNVRPVKEIIKHPIGTITSALRSDGAEKAAESLHNTAVPHGEDVRLIRTHDKAVAAKTDDEKEQAMDELAAIKETRQDLFVKWTFDQHLTDVRVFPPNAIPWRRRHDFVVADDRGKTQMHWADYGQHILSYTAERYGGQYIGVSSEPPPANQDTINSSGERLLLSSSSIQAIMMQLRNVYRWEDRKITSYFLAAYLVLWSLNCLFGFSILALIGFVIQRRSFPPTMEHFREDVERSETSDKQAQNLAELIERHGTRGWVDALMDKAGPILMMQMEDAANLFERIQNFYEWRHPSRTVRTLVLLGLTFIAVVFTPTWLLVKGSLLMAGLMFFGSFPIASRYPQYRLLVSPFTFLLWDIPTHSEWAIARIQAEARLNSKNMHQTAATIKESTDPHHKINPNFELNPIEVGQYRCMSCDHLGSLCITSTGMRFVTKVRSNERWHMSFTELKSMRKSPQSINSVPFNYGGELRFTRWDDEEFQVSGLKARDEVFTQIIGYSGLRWQTIW